MKIVKKLNTVVQVLANASKYVMIYFNARMLQMISHVRIVPEVVRKYVLFDVKIPKFALIVI